MERAAGRSFAGAPMARVQLTDRLSALAHVADTARSGRTRWLTLWLWRGQQNDGRAADARRGGVAARPARQSGFYNSRPQKSELA